MKTKFFYLLLILMVLSACSDESEPEKRDDGFIVLASRLFISAQLTDADGNDWLDPTNERYVDPEGIKLYALTKEGKVQYAGDGVERRGFVNGHKELTFGKHYVSLLMGLYSQGGWSKDIIQWNDALADTVVCQVDSAHYIVQKVYLNGELQYDIDNPKDNYSYRKWVIFKH